MLKITIERDPEEPKQPWKRTKSEDSHFSISKVTTKTVNNHD